MLRHRWIWAAITVVMGGLQAWDSGTFQAPTTIQAIVLIALAIPAMAIVTTGSYGLQALSVAAAFVLLTIARVLSPVSLPTLHIAAFIPAVIIFFSHVIDNRRTAPNSTS